MEAARLLKFMLQMKVSDLMEEVKATLPQEGIEVIDSKYLEYHDEPSLGHFRQMLIDHNDYTKIEYLGKVVRWWDTAGVYMWGSYQDAYRIGESGCGQIRRPSMGYRIFNEYIANHWDWPWIYEANTLAGIIIANRYQSKDAEKIALRIYRKYAERRPLANQKNAWLRTVSGPTGQTASEHYD